MRKILLWSVVLCAFLSVLQAGSFKVELTVRDDVGMNRTSEPVTSGIPIPIGQNLNDVTNLRVLTDTGRVIPAQFTVLARWNGLPTDKGKPIQWVLVDFQADVAS